MIGFDVCIPGNDFELNKMSSGMNGLDLRIRKQIGSGVGTGLGGGGVK